MPLNIRIMLDVIMIVVAFTAPWWFVVICAFVLLWFTDYIEIIFLGAILDALYGRILFVILGYAVFVISLYLKPRLSFYRRF
jgi:hypothetical protein